MRLVKELAVAQELVVDENRSAAEQRAQEARSRQAALAVRAEKVEQLRRDFYVLASSTEDPQKRGYGLEDLLAELFELHDITYRRPYRTQTGQIDGHFEFKGFDYLVEVQSEADVRALTPDLGRLRTLPVRGVIVTSRAASAGVDFVSRFFAPAAGVDEDPVTGSAHCCLTPYWSHKLGKQSMEARQLSARGGVLRVQLDGDRVRLAGQAVTVLRGELTG